MPIIEADPFTGQPIAVRHESATGWGRRLLKQHGLDALKKQVLEELTEDEPCLRAPGAASEIQTSTTVDGGVTEVAAWARCTLPVCVAYGAAIDTLNTAPFASLDRTALSAALAASRTQLATPAMTFTDESDNVPVVWAYRTGVLREVGMWLSWQAFDTTYSPRTLILRTAVKEAGERAAALGFDLSGGPGDIKRLGAAAPVIWETAARSLHSVVTALTAAVDRHITESPAPCAT
ncbi:hypothetical protein GTY75_08905 [Streptomyces sp. SID8381]|uniref:hypothetical protein n=1 Tax=unclassified Streptomyces TaxID=2593676 RepID=UPI000366C2D4|nr:MULTISPECIES: hypothetical protein [unclassified Streptomyces]MYX26786.1 hypothetical protein [Streptomyces sp. SID8381]